MDDGSTIDINIRARIHVEIPDCGELIDIASYWSQLNSIEGFNWNPTSPARPVEPRVFKTSDHTGFTLRRPENVTLPKRQRVWQSGLVSSFEILKKDWSIPGLRC